MATYTKPTDTTNVIERWLNNQTSGATSPASIVTPGQDIALTGSYVWGNDPVFGKYVKLSGASDTAAANVTVPATGSLSLDCFFADNGALNTGVSGQMGLQLTIGGGNNLFYLFKRAGTGVYESTIFNSASSPYQAQGQAFLAGAVYLIGSYNLTNSLLTLYVNGVKAAQISAPVPRFTNTSVQVNLASDTSGNEQGHAPMVFASIYNYAIGDAEALSRYNAIIGAAPPPASGGVIFSPYVAY